jgi:integrase/recombinase XerD
MRSSQYDWATDAAAYDHHFANSGHSTYTRRSYGLGIRHFTKWSISRHLRPEQLSRSVIARYIADWTLPRKARTINHRLSVIAGFISFCIERDDERGWGPWRALVNPLAAEVSAKSGYAEWAHRTPLQRGRRVSLRRRVGHSSTPRVPTGAVAQLLANCLSLRDRAVITLLSRTGQRIGDWHTRHGQHGILGMRLCDLDPVNKTITVRLKGTRRLHRVPASDDCWPALHEYLRVERGVVSPTDFLWVMRRRGQRRPLNYAAFEISLRRLTRRCGVRLHAHVFRHELAQLLLESTGKLQVVQAMLGHAHLSTTANQYTEVTDVQITEALKAIERIRAVADKRTSRYAFAYSGSTVVELEQAIAPRIRSIRPSP